MNSILGDTKHFFPSLTSSFLLVFLSELADKSFLLIVIMTSKLSSLYLYITATLSTLMMNSLAIGLGFILPKLISEMTVNIIAFNLFLFFGIFSLYESKNMNEDNDNFISFSKNELINNENINYIDNDNINEDNIIIKYNNDKYCGNNDNDNDYELMENNDTIDTSVRFNTRSTYSNNFNFNSRDSLRSVNINNIELSNNNNDNNNDNNNNNNINNGNNNDRYISESELKLCAALFATFAISEIGDKSEIATITIASIYNLWGVIFGTSLAFMTTNGIAVLFGKWICSKISTKKILLFGGILFILFALNVFLQIIF